MKKYLFLTGILLCTLLANAQTFQDFLNRVGSLPEANHQAVVDSFMNAANTFPFIEDDTLTHFIYQGTATGIKVAGDATGWSPELVMEMIAGTNFWYHTTSYPSDARLDYKFVLNGSNWILDPLNPNTCAGGFGPNSELRMPGYVNPPELAYYSGIPHGILKDTTFSSASLGNSRKVTIYLPPGYESSAEDYPVILFHDGLEYLSLGSTNNILDYLISQQKILPLIGIFVPPVDRTAEYAGNKIDLFTAFIVNDLMGAIDQKYRTSKDPDKRAMAGASNGGNISLYIGMKHPEAFGKIAAQSSNVIQTISNTLQFGNKLDLEFYIDIGTYDISQLIPMVHNLATILESKKYSYRFYEWNEGHSWGNWKGHLRLPLMQFFSGPDGINENGFHPDIRLRQNHPNPFRGETLIPYSLPSGQPGELWFLTAKGDLLEKVLLPSSHQPERVYSFMNHSYPSGTYFYNLRSGNGSVTKKMIITK
ncbi:MAG: alpha/beta hydrolase-fold protein [bacterium]